MGPPGKTEQRTADGYIIQEEEEKLYYHPDALAPYPLKVVNGGSTMWTYPEGSKNQQYGNAESYDDYNPYAQQQPGPPFQAPSAKDAVYNKFGTLDEPEFVLPRQNGKDPSVLNERAQGGSTNIFRELLCACVRVDNRHNKKSEVPQAPPPFVQNFQPEISRIRQVSVTEATMRMNSAVIDVYDEDTLYDFLERARFALGLSVAKSAQLGQGLDSVPLKDPLFLKTGQQVIISHLPPPLPRSSEYEDSICVNCGRLQQEEQLQPTPCMVHSGFRAVPRSWLNGARPSSLEAAKLWWERCRQLCNGKAPPPESLAGINFNSPAFAAATDELVAFSRWSCCGGLVHAPGCQKMFHLYCREVREERNLIYGGRDNLKTGGATLEDELRDMMGPTVVL